MKTHITKEIDLAAEALAKGQVIGLPTETVYGLAGSALNETAISDIYSIKGRPRNNPLILHISGIDKLETIAEGIPQSAFDLAAEFWPGPLTLVLPKRPTVPNSVTSGLDTVAVRVPAHPMAQKLLSAVNFPVAAPSANPFGRVSPTTAAHVMEYFEGKIPLILDGAPCRVGIESTIVGFEGESPVIYRQGSVTEDQIRRVAGTTALYLNDDKSPKAPGMLSRHYAPNTRLLVTTDIASAIKSQTGKKIGLITFTDSKETGITRRIALSPEGNPDAAAANLYQALNDMDKSGVQVIIAETFPDTGIGKAINDKLLRASKR